MVLPFIIAGSVAVRYAIPLVRGLLAKTGRHELYKQARKSAAFGIGYGGGTVIGFNLVPQFGRSSKRYSNKSTSVNLDKKMPYGRSYGRRYSRSYSRYSRRYRRYAPRRSYRSRYY